MRICLCIISTIMESLALTVFSIVMVPSYNAYYSWTYFGNKGNPNGYLFFLLQGSVITMRMALGTIMVETVMLAASTSAMGMVPLKNFYNADLVRYYGGGYGLVHYLGRYFYDRSGSVRLQCE